MSIYEFGPFQLHGERLLLMHGGRHVALGPKVVETLLALLEHPGELCTKRDLMERIWPEGYVEEANLSQNIHVLRRTFATFDFPDAIETMARRGYRFAAPVRILAPQTARGQSPARRIGAGAAGMAFVVATFLLLAAYVPAHRGAQRIALSANGGQLYEAGQYYWNLRTRDGVRRSLWYFAKVIDSDPRNALGYAALAAANITMGDYCYGTHLPAVYFARADAYAGKALSFDPQSVQGHAALGYLALNRKQLATSLAELRRAISIDPSYSPAHEWFGIALQLRGETAHGIAELKIAATLDPLSVATTAWLAKSALRQGRFSEAVTYSREALELSPKRTDVLRTLGAAYEALGDAPRAIDTYQRLGAVGPYYRPEAAALLVRAFAQAHRMRESRKQFEFARTHAVEPHSAFYA